VINPDELAEQYGKPVNVRPYDALVMAMNAPQPVTLHINGTDILARTYRDPEAADAWLAQADHPVLATVPLADGTVLGILDLRPALRAAKEARDARARQPRGPRKGKKS
jgi:hypothetical protein